MESAGLAHTEARHIAKRLPLRAIAEGRNLLLDVTMGSAPSVRSWLVNLGLAVYSVDVVIAAIDRDDAVRWAEEEGVQGWAQINQLGVRGPRPNARRRPVPSSSLRQARCSAGRWCRIGSCRCWKGCAPNA